MHHIKKKTGLSTPLVTCITDISMHPEWKADQTDLYLAPTREIKEHLICEGTKAENILVTGIPVRQQFLNMDRNHLENEKKVRRVLVMGGGLGLMPDLRRLLGKNCIVCNLFRSLLLRERIIKCTKNG